MLIPAIGLAMLGALAQAAATTPDPGALDARLGPCTAEFTVKDASGAPVYGATVHVRVQYGPLNVKRMDLEIGTDSDGKARIKGLPEKAKPLAYDIQKGDKKATASQDLAKSCQGKHEITFK